jgi:hypothetical protein
MIENVRDNVVEENSNFLWNLMEKLYRDTQKTQPTFFAYIILKEERASTFKVRTMQ